MKELWRKKSVRIVLAVIVIVVAVGVIGISAQSSHKRRDYNSHVDAAKKYLIELDYEQAIVEYTLALEIEPNSKEIMDALEKTYLTYAETYEEIEEYERAIEILERGYAQTNRESLRERMEELIDLQVQKEEEEKERLLAEEAAEKQRLSEEEKEKQRQQEKVENEEDTKEESNTEEEADGEDREADTEETTDSIEETEETQQSAEKSGMAEVYQAKAAEYVFALQRDFFENKYRGDSWIDAPWVDARSLKTQEEFCEYFNNDISVSFQGKTGATIGAVNTQLLEETESQCRILVSDMVYYTYVDSPFADVPYFEFVIDKATGQGTIVDCHYDVVYVIYEPGFSSMLELNARSADDYYGCEGRVFNFND